MPRGNAFVGTINFNDDELKLGEPYFAAFHEKLAAKVAKKSTSCFYAGQVEEGDESKRTHIQFFIHTPKRTDFIKLNSKIWNRAHLDFQRGTNEENLRYCCAWDNKDKPTARYQICQGELIPEDMQNASAQGRRSDLEKWAKKVQETGSLKCVWDGAPSLAMQYGRGFKEALRHHQETLQTDDRKIAVYIIFGPTGAGKSRLARKLAGGKPHYYSVPCPQLGQPKWFDGYNGHSAIILEEFDHTLWTPQYINQLTDRYDMQVAVKGGFVPALWTTVVITANEHPRHWWRNADQRVVDGVIRRTVEVIEFEEPAKYVRPQWPVGRKRKYQEDS